MRSADQALILRHAVKPAPEKCLNPEALARLAPITPGAPVMVLLAAGKGTRFGRQPKCAQPVNGIPLARHTIEAFHRFSPSPAICVVGYRHAEVAAALGDDVLFVRSDHPAGGTALAAYEAFSVPELEARNPVLIVTMGDRIVPTSILRRLYETHLVGPREAELTFLTAIYEPPRNRGKGRVIRDADRTVLSIIEQRDIDALADGKLRQPLDDLTEGNCPLYVIRAQPFRRHLEGLSNDNAQRQYYLTDVIERVRRAGGEIRTLTTTVADPEYDLLCSDVTRPMDLALMEGILRSSQAAAEPVARAAPEIAQAERLIRADRPAGQVASIALQLGELLTAARRLEFKPDRAVALGIAGGRLRIAFMHPDMGRFYGPAWQMPIGAASSSGREQIVTLIQSSDDQQIHLAPTNPEFREKVDVVPADSDCMYPGAEVADWYSYEGFGTKMAESLLLALGYFTDEELQRRKARGQPLPPASLWIRASMRRPFSLVGNAIASLRTLRTGTLGARTQAALGREGFRGLRIVSTGNIPRGGFSSSSAVTVATKNALNALFDLGISPDMLVHLSCQAEYGTGVRAGPLDQATEQKGQTGQGTLLSSNPRDNYRVLGTYPVPADRFQVIFPYSVDRDREAWRWSADTYASEPESERPTTGEMRKLTGKSAELAALLLRLPLEQDFFKYLEDDFLQQGSLGLANRRWVGDVLRRLPLLISQDELRQRVQDQRTWYIEQLCEAERLTVSLGTEKTDATFASLFAGWRDPLLRRAPEGEVRFERGVPLRAMVGYLFGEVAKNFRLIHHPNDWIEWVTRSQWGDRCFTLDPDRLPDAAAMMTELAWEKGLSGPVLMQRWLEWGGARPFDYNRGLEDTALASDRPPPEIHWFEGTNFFRGLALIDLAEAMLKRAFGGAAVAVRVNAAGQGDFFQVHLDTWQVRVEEVKGFLRQAFYRRFGLTPETEFVEPHPGGGAVGVRLDRFDRLPDLVQALSPQDT